VIRFAINQSLPCIGLYSVAIYGGLILFGAFLLYDTQKIIYKAERHPVGYGAPPFDPVNASVGIYLGEAVCLNPGP
jgi:hypothetical protein